MAPLHSLVLLRTFPSQIAQGYFTFFVLGLVLSRSLSSICSGSCSFMLLVSSAFFVPLFSFIPAFITLFVLKRNLDYTTGVRTISLTFIISPVSPGTSLIISFVLTLCLKHGRRLP